jgi:hypothetical protein
LHQPAERPTLARRRDQVRRSCERLGSQSGADSTCGPARSRALQRHRVGS